MHGNLTTESTRLRDGFQTLNAKTTKISTYYSELDPGSGYPKQSLILRVCCRSEAFHPHLWVVTKPSGYMTRSGSLVTSLKMPAATLASVLTPPASTPPWTSSASARKLPGRAAARQRRAPPTVPLRTVLTF